MEQSVQFVRVAQYEEAAVVAAVEALFAAMPAAQNIGADTKILLKPNLLAKHTPEHAVTTHPMVLLAAIRACKARGAQAANITVADSSGGLYNPLQMKATYRTCGLLAVCEAEGVCAYTACESRTVPVEGGAVVSAFEILAPVLDADFIVNLPKFKTHVMTGMTAATKNMFGVIPGLKKAEWHTRFPDKERFGEMLLDLHGVVTPQLNVLDAIVGMEGDGPAGGTPKQVGLLLASESAIALDGVVAALMGLDAMRVPYLFAARGRGLCAQVANLSDCREVDAAPSGAPLNALEGWQLPDSYQGSRVGDVNFAAHVPAVFRPVAHFCMEKIAPHPVVQHSDCIGCGKCAEICPQDTIELKGGKATIRKSKCIRCFCCHEMCPVKAIAVKKFELFKL